MGKRSNVHQDKSPRKSKDQVEYEKQPQLWSKQQKSDALQDEEAFKRWYQDELDARLKEERDWHKQLTPQAEDGQSTKQKRRFKFGSKTVQAVSTSPQQHLSDQQTLLKPNTSDKTYHHKHTHSTPNHPKPEGSPVAKTSPLSSQMSIENAGPALSEKEKEDIVKNVKDLTLIVSSLCEKVHQKRENILNLELQNSRLSEAVEFNQEAVQKLKTDLHHIEKDYKKANRTYRRAKESKDAKFDPAELQKQEAMEMRALDSNIELLAEMTINAEVIPNVYRDLRMRKCNEQNRSLKQLEERLHEKKKTLSEIQEMVAKEETELDQLCLKSETLEREKDEGLLGGYRTQSNSQLRTIAGILSFYRFSVDDVSMEIDYTCDINQSQMNKMCHDLQLEIIKRREGMVTLQNIAAEWLKLNKRKGKKPKVTEGETDKTALKNMTAELLKLKKQKEKKPKTTEEKTEEIGLPDEQAYWIQEQIKLSALLEKIPALQVEELAAEIHAKDQVVLSKIISLMELAEFTSSKREKFLSTMIRNTSRSAIVPV